MSRKPTEQEVTDALALLSTAPVFNNLTPLVLDCLANADDDVRRAFRVVISVSQYIEIAVSTQTTVQRDN